MAKGSNQDNSLTISKSATTRNGLRVQGGVIVLTITNPNGQALDFYGADAPIMAEILEGELPQTLVEVQIPTPDPRI